MTDLTSPAPAGNEAQPSAVATDGQSVIDNALREMAEKEPAPESADTQLEQPKALTVEEELDKLRKAKSRDDRRIGKLTALKYQQQKELEAFRAAKAAPQQQAQAGAELSVARTGVPSKLDQNSFANWAEYTEARQEEIADYKIDQRFAEREAKQQQSNQTAHDQAWEAERMKTVDQMGADFMKETPDAAALMNEHAETIRKFSPELKRAILTTENTPLALYNLAKDGMLEELADMSLEDARVELRLAERKPAAKPKSKAPTPLPASRSSAASDKPYDKYTPEEAWKLLTHKD